MGKLQAGIARVCITPPIGVELAGYGPFLNRRSETVHDDLYAEALVIDDGDVRAALITSDLIAYDDAITSQVRKLAAQGTGIPPEHIMLSCVHSHTAPTARFLRAWGERDWQYLGILPRYLGGAVSAATRSLRPVRIGFGQGEHRQLAWNRLHQDETVNPNVLVMRIDDASSEEPIAVLINYACHAVMLGPSTAISADYPGAVRRHVEAALPGCLAMFANGACGDIDPVSNREVWGQATFDDVDQAGASLAEDVVEIVRGVRTMDEAQMRVRSVITHLPLQTMNQEQVESALLQSQQELNRLRPEGAADRMLDRARFQLGWARDARDMLRIGAAPAESRAEIQGIALGEGVLLGLPAEVFTEIGWAIKANSDFPCTFLITYANGDVGYITTEQDFLENGYAATMAPMIYDTFPFTTDVGDRFTDAAGRLLEELTGN
jgi:neutral ceramidase